MQFLKEICQVSVKFESVKKLLRLIKKIIQS